MALETRLREEGVDVLAVDARHRIRYEQQYSYYGHMALSRPKRGIRGTDIRAEYRGQVPPQAPDALGTLYDEPLSSWTWLSAITNELDPDEPVDGVVGFGEGAAVAAVLGRLLPIMMPSHPPLQFCVLYSGYLLERPFPQHFYEPLISTPTLHVISAHAARDSWAHYEFAGVASTMALYDACDPSTRSLLRHPPEAIVLEQPEYLDPVVQYILDNARPPSPPDGETLAGTPPPLPLPVEPITPPSSEAAIDPSADTSQAQADARPRADDRLASPQADP